MRKSWIVFVVWVGWSVPALSQAPDVSSMTATSVVPQGYLWFTNGQALSEAENQRFKQLEQWFSREPLLSETQRLRIQWLEEQGQIPTNANFVDLQLASRTSW